MGARKTDGRVARCRRRFLSFYPGGFADEDYIALERDYKWNAHLEWRRCLSRAEMQRAIARGDHGEVAATAIRIESRTNLLFSFEKMAVRDAIKSDEGSRAFARGLDDWLHGRGSDESRFERWCEVVASLPRRQTRVLTWPVVTVFGFIAQPDKHIFLKPNVTRVAAEEYGFPFEYRSKPSWGTYASLQGFANAVRRDTADLRPRDMIDIQSFIWVQGSSEYD